MPVRPPPLDLDPAPVAPVRPGNDECCRSGCTPCVFDLYAQELERFQADLQAWRERQKHKPAPPSGS